MINRLLSCVIILFLAAPAMAQQVGIAAIVNEEVITTTDVTDRRDFIMATSEIPPTAEAQAKLTPRILEALVNETLQLQEARRTSIDVEDSEIDAAIAKIEQQRGRPPGSLREFIKNNGLSARTMEQQIRAQISWNKVVERRLRRSVNIAEDEIARAQLAQASAPGRPEIRIAAASIPFSSPKEEEAASKLAEDLAAKLNGGADFIAVAQDLATTGKAKLNPPIWVPEEGLQPAMQQALRSLKPGQVTQPLRSQNSYQLISLLDRRMSKPTPDTTEVVVKQMSIPMPEKKTPETMAATRDLSRAVRAFPVNCESGDMGELTGKVKVEFVRATYKQMSPDLRSVIEHLGVTEVSEPLLTANAIMIVTPCERIEPATNLPDAEKVRTQLYNDKLELEAQKTLRNLRRDAFIDIKGE